MGEEGEAKREGWAEEGKGQRCKGGTREGEVMKYSFRIMNVTAELLSSLLSVNSSCSGVSPHNRGDVWSFLVKQKLSLLQEQGTDGVGDGPTVPEYQEVKGGVTDYEQVIQMDLGERGAVEWRGAVMCSEVL